jgi:hypothetical protein
MSKGIVLYDDETTGYYQTLDNGAILINFETTKNSDNILELARETGAALVLLEEPEIPAE